MVMAASTMFTSMGNLSVAPYFLFGITSTSVVQSRDLQLL